LIAGVAHVGIAVHSIDKARQLYEALGLEIETVEEVPEEQVRVAMIPCGAMHIELLEPTAPGSPIARFLETRGPGLHHLCLASDGLDADDGALRAAGYQRLRDVPTRGAGGCRVQFIHPKSASGVLLELSEPPLPPPRSPEATR